MMKDFDDRLQAATAVSNPPGSPTSSTSVRVRVRVRVRVS